MVLPDKLTTEDPEALRRRYKLVRRDTLADVAPGSLILMASIETGLAKMLRRDGVTIEDFDLGPYGFRILMR